MNVHILYIFGEKLKDSLVTTISHILSLGRLERVIPNGAVSPAFMHTHISMVQFHHKIYHVINTVWFKEFWFYMHFRFLGLMN